MSTREERGRAIAKSGGQIRKVGPRHYVVKSQSDNGEYDVVAIDAGWTCTCPDCESGNACCKTSTR